MTAGLGQIFLVVGCFAALTQAIVCFVGAGRHSDRLMRLGRRAAIAQVAGFSAAFAALIYAYIVSDFRLLNVALNSHTDKPLLYKISGVWGNHEGSMLLWLLILALFGAFTALRKAKDMPEELRARAIGVQGLLAFGFALYELAVSNPFLALDQAPPNGRGLNPILQDPGLALHPPLLYLGYVGCSMPFSFAVASLIEGRKDCAWVTASRRSLRAAWTFLTLGVVMGSLWAYTTLGWGGWWAWDPVENASLLPWLAATALLHIAFVAEKREIMKGLAVFLAILTFSLSLMGTFLVRSGALSSVHSFATDPTRGTFVLAVMALATGGALALFAWRAPMLTNSQDTPSFELLSRETMMLVACLALALALGNVALGTLYPLAIEAFQLGRVTVGPPYFNLVFVPPILAMAAIMGPGAMLAWGRGGAIILLPKFRFASVVGMFVALALWAIEGSQAFVTILAMGLAAWLFAGCLVDAAERIQLGKVHLVESLRKIPQMSRTRAALLLAHSGLAVMIVGVAGSAAWSTDEVKRLQTGETAVMAGYRVTLKSVGENLKGPNYSYTRGVFELTHEDGDEPQLALAPELRFYDSPPMALAHAAIHTRWLTNLYLVLAAKNEGENSEGQNLSHKGYVVHLYRHPLTPLIFAGGFMMTAGGIVSSTRRGNKKKKH
ncbi:MAG: heme lyase CcmF/NrfE family subunit [Bdellovibrionales bacterium]